MWAELAAAGSHVRAEGGELVVRHRRGAPDELRAAVPVVAPKLLAVASGRWRLDLASWPAWRREAFGERAAIMADQPDVAPELVEQLAYLDTADQPDPVDHQAGGDVELVAVEGQEKLELSRPPAGGAGGGPQAHAREAWADTPEAWATWLASAQPWRSLGEVARILADVASG